MNCQSKKVAMIGGTFNPIHIGHLAIAQEVLEYKKLDKVVFIPAGNPPHKNENIVSAKDRLKMAKLAIKENSKFEICDYEIKKETKSYSLETVRYLKNKYEDCKIYFIMGEDSLLSIETWNRYEEFLNEIKVLVVKRSCGESKDLDEKIDELNKKGYIIEKVPFNFLEISSTEIRDKLKNGESPRYYLEKNTFDYIKKEGLYV